MAGKKQIIEVKGTEIAIIQANQSDYISLTGIARYKNSSEPKDVVKNWRTYAHKDIAFEFGAWISAEFKLYLILEFQRLKEDESAIKKQEWNLLRTLSKINYRILSDAIKESLIPSAVTKEQSSTIYASEADLLNVALFGMTARRWRVQNAGRSLK